MAANNLDVATVTPVVIRAIAEDLANAALFQTPVNPQSLEIPRQLDAIACDDKHPDRAQAAELFDEIYPTQIAASRDLMLAQMQQNTPRFDMATFLAPINDYSRVDLPAQIIDGINTVKLALESISADTSLDPKISAEAEELHKAIETAQGARKKALRFQERALDKIDRLRDHVSQVYPERVHYFPAKFDEMRDRQWPELMTTIKDGKADLDTLQQLYNALRSLAEMEAHEVKGTAALINQLRPLVPELKKQLTQKINEAEDAMEKTIAADYEHLRDQQLPDLIRTISDGNSTKDTWQEVFDALQLIAIAKANGIAGTDDERDKLAAVMPQLKAQSEARAAQDDPNRVTAISTDYENLRDYQLPALINTITQGYATPETRKIVDDAVAVLSKAVGESASKLERQEREAVRSSLTDALPLLRAQLMATGSMPFEGVPTDKYNAGSHARAQIAQLGATMVKHSRLTCVRAGQAQSYVDLVQTPPPSGTGQVP